VRHIAAPGLAFETRRRPSDRRSDDVSTSATPRPQAVPRSPTLEQRSGWVTFAVVLLSIAGVLNVIYGVAAVSNSSFFLQNTRYILSGLNTWGWVTLILGVVQLFAALSLWGGGLFGRIVGIASAGLSAIAALMSIPAYPLWSLAIFALDVVIIHQIAVRGTEGRRPA
jgi:hypothetical protein